VTLNLTNDGNTAAAGPLLIAFAASPNADGSDPFNLVTLSTPIKLAPGASKLLRLKVPLPIGAPTGNEFLVTTVDPNNAFADPNESNNVSISVTAISMG
jgi:CARDB